MPFRPLPPLRPLAFTALSSVALLGLHCSGGSSSFSAPPNADAETETPDDTEDGGDDAGDEDGAPAADAGARRDGGGKDASSGKDAGKESASPTPGPPLACGLSGQVECGGVCVDSDDPAHCGACFQACPAPSGGTVACVSGECSPRCPIGQALIGAACQPVATGSVTPMMALGSDHSCALTSQGAVRCWGLNVNAQLGNGTTSPNGSGATHKVPGDVVGLGGGVTFIASGSTFSCAITAPGAVRCWGANGRGELGLGATGLPKSTPIQDVVGLGGTPSALSLGSGHACAVVGGAVKCWGRNSETQLGDGTSVNRSAPIQVAGLANVVSVRAGSTFSCALTGAGAVKCWGQNIEGLGTGSSSSLTPQAVTGLGAGVVAIGAGYTHACALLATGAVKCWGDNIWGQLGDGTKTDRAAPVDVVGLTGVAELAVGGNVTCARLSSGSLKCWGKNLEGSVGDGTNVHRTTPTAVSGLSGVTRVFAGGAHVCAQATGGLRCWGRNHYGQLGDGTDVDRTLPTPVSY